MYCVVLIIRLASHSGPLTPNWILLTYVNCVPFDHLRRPTQIFLLQLKKCFYLCVCLGMIRPGQMMAGQQPGSIHPPAPSGAAPGVFPDVDMSHLSEEERMLIESVMAKAQMEELEQQSTSLSTAAKPANLRYTTYYLHPFISISNRETILVVAPKVFHQQLLPPLHCCQVRTILSVSRRQSNNEDSVIHPAAPAAVGRTWIQQRSSKLKLVGNKWLVSEGLCVCPAALLCPADLSFPF